MPGGSSKMVKPIVIETVAGNIQNGRRSAERVGQ
jgi:hypothetical protein